MERSTRRIYNRPVRKIFGSPSFQGSARGDQYLLIVVGGGGVDEGGSRQLCRKYWSTTPGTVCTDAPYPYATIDNEEGIGD